MHLGAFRLPVNFQTDHPKRAFRPVFYPIKPDVVCGGNFRIVPTHDLRPAVEKLFDAFQLRNTECCLQIGDPIVKSALFVKIPPLSAHCMVAQPSGMLIELLIIGGQHAAFTSSNDFVSIKAEDAAFSEAANLATLVFSAV